MKIVASILAAGKCGRFGYPKFLMNFGNKSIIKILIEETLPVFDEVIVISGYYHNMLEKHITEVPLLYNKYFEEGMSSSIKISSVYAKNNNTDALCIIPSDMPFLYKDIFKTIRNIFEDNKLEAIAFLKDDNLSPPTIFSKSVYNKLLLLNGDKGGKNLLENLEKKIVLKDFENYLIDIDTQEDYLSFLIRAFKFLF